MAISCRQLRFRRGFPVIQPGTARFPRRFAPRNDNSGAFTVLTMAFAVREFRAGRGMSRPCNASMITDLIPPETGMFPGEF